MSSVTANLKVNIKIINSIVCFQKIDFKLCAAAEKGILADSGQDDASKPSTDVKRDHINVTHINISPIAMQIGHFQELYTFAVSQWLTPHCHDCHCQRANCHSCHP